MGTKETLGSARQFERQKTLDIQQRAMQAVSIGIVIVDATHDDHPIIFCNPEMEAVTGLRTGDILGQSIDRLLSDLQQQESTDELRSAFSEGQPCQLVLKNGREDGSSVWYELTLLTVNDEAGNLTHFVGTFNDITRHRLAQGELEKEKGLFEGVFRGIPDALMLASLDRVITFCNPGVRQVFGYEPAELIGQSARILYAKQQDYQRQGQVRFRPSAETRYTPVELTLQKKNGELFDAELVGTILKTQSGEALGFLGLVRDITQRKEAEAEQCRYYRVLEALSTGTRIDDLLKLVVQLAEEARPGMLGSILLLDESKQFLKNGYAASLPAAYNLAIDGIQIGPAVGSCGTAAFSGWRVIVEEIATHPYWKEFRSLAEAAELRACWSEPIMSPKDEILGTLAMYFREPQTPTSADLELLKHSAQLAGIVLDRARIYDRVKKSESRYRSLVEASSSIVWTASPDGRFTSPQLAWESYTGQSWPQHQGDGWMQMIHPQDRKKLAAYWRASLKSGNAIRTQGRCWHDGSQQYRYIDVHAIPIQDENGKIVEWVGTTTDVHERRTAENTLQFNEERLSLALQVTDDAIWDSDLVTGAVWRNQAYQNQFGRPTDATDSWQWWLDRIHPADRDRVRSSLESFIADSCVSDRWMEQYRFVRADGSYAHIVDRALLVRDENGRPVRVLGAMQDVTERRALEKRVLEAATETQRAIGHDLHDGVGQELTGLAMLTDSLAMALRRKSLDESQLAEKIGLGIERTLEQVRTLARGMNPVEVDPLGLMSALVELTERARQLYGTECLLACGDEVSISDSETATQLYRIAQEAITNAVKHGNATKINVELLQNNDSVELRILDNGVGISSQLPMQSGTGMKSMLYRAEVIGGKLRVAPSSYGGTMVACTIPVKPDSTETGINTVI